MFIPQMMTYESEKPRWNDTDRTEELGRKTVPVAIYP
jgi:hypothetical protein